MDWEKIVTIFKKEPRFRLRQVERVIFKDLIEDWKEATILTKALRTKLAKECSLKIDGQILESSEKRTKKAILTLADGIKIESVLMRRKSGKNAVCVSCQAGCPIGCAFCATGKMGFQRNLSAGEIIQQVLFWQRFLKKENAKITSVVFMGMGEPFLNYDQVKEAILFLNKEETFNLGQRKISVSTVGIIEGIEKFSKEDWQVNLAISVHFVDWQKRQLFMPIEKTQPLKKVLSAIHSYLEKNRRKVMIEYALFDKINDSPAEAVALVKILKKELGNLFMVNLIAGNPVGEFRPSKKKSLEVFQKKLAVAGLDVIRRFSFGADIQGACGQLVVGKSDSFKN